MAKILTKFIDHYRGTEGTIIVVIVRIVPVDTIVVTVERIADF